MDENFASVTRHAGKPSRRAVLKALAALSASSVRAAVKPVPPSRAGGRELPSHDSWVSTTSDAAWQTRSFERTHGDARAYSSIRLEDRPGNPAIEGFGACFNELGWTSLQRLSAGDRASIFHELFTPGHGASLNLCRMPVGANDFARDWYSYDEAPNDFGLDHFDLKNDRETLVPFIQSVQRFNPALRLWASPWSPPSWMKKNGHYAEAQQQSGRPPNGLKPEQVGHEGEDMFVREPRFYRAYADYFGKFIDGYKALGIPIEMVMPQNEFNSAQPFPSCTWSPEGLAEFIGYLGPEMDPRGVRIFFGTLERGDPGLLERVLAVPSARRWIHGVGVQWAGKGAVPAIRAKYPSLALYQSEQECGDGKNDWSYASYCWTLMKHYLGNGSSAYMYWNISLLKGGISRWGWPQNSLITVDTAASTYRFNHEYFVLKHVSHFVRPGAKLMALSGGPADALAFKNRDGSAAVVLRNGSAVEIPFQIESNKRFRRVILPPDSLSTVTFSGERKTA